MRTVDEILKGDALAWSEMALDQLRSEHEQLRRALETSRAQTSVLVDLQLKLSMEIHRLRTSRVSQATPCVWECGSDARYIDVEGRLVCALCPIKRRENSIRMVDVGALLVFARQLLIGQRPSALLEEDAVALRMIVGPGVRR